MRVGIGYDIHRLQKGRSLIIGGVAFPGAVGLIGHSDADVLLHAVIDAILGAASLGDIGHHFPPEEAEHEDADSHELLAEACQMALEAGYRVGNVDATVIAEQPRIGPMLDAIRERIAEATGCDKTAINVKATTNEGVGTIGSGGAIAAMAVVLLNKAS